jgi:cation/acetate symporter
VTIAVSLVTDSPPRRIKRIVRQCHSPEPMGQQQTAEDVVAAESSGGPGGVASGDD